MDWSVRTIQTRVIDPAAHYVMGRRCGPLLFLAGQIAAIPAENRIVRGYEDLAPEDAARLRTGSMNVDMKEGPIVAQSFFIWNNIKLMLEEQGSSLDNILFVTTYIRNMEWFPSLARVRQMFFGNDYPPGTICEVSQLGLSDDILVEVEPVAAIPT